MSEEMSCPKPRPCASTGGEVDDGGVAGVAGDGEAQASGWADEVAAVAGVDGAFGGAGGGGGGVGGGVDGAEVVGDEVVAGEVGVEVADLAVGADAGDGDVGVDGAGSVVDVGGVGGVGDVGGDELSEAEAVCFDGGEVDDRGVAGVAGNGEAQTTRRADLAGGGSGRRRHHRCDQHPDDHDRCPQSPHARHRSAEIGVRQ